MNRQRGFTLLEVLVATALMGITVAGVLGALAASSRNAARLGEYDRATILAQAKMEELLAEPKLPRNVPMEGQFDAAVTGGIPCGWRATIFPFEAVPNAGPGYYVVDRVVIEIWWLTGASRNPARRSFSLEGYRRGVLQPQDFQR